jgi:hypothetical protein
LPPSLLVSRRIGENDASLTSLFSFLADEVESSGVAPQESSSGDIREAEARQRGHTRTLGYEENAIFMSKPL